MAVPDTRSGQAKEPTSRPEASHQDSQNDEPKTQTAKMTESAPLLSQRDGWNAVAPAQAASPRHKQARDGNKTAQTTRRHGFQVHDDPPFDIQTLSIMYGIDTHDHSHGVDQSGMRVASDV